MRSEFPAREDVHPAVFLTKGGESVSYYICVRTLCVMPDLGCIDAGSKREMAHFKTLVEIYKRFTRSLRRALLLALLRARRKTPQAVHFRSEHEIVLTLGSKNIAFFLAKF